MSRLLGIRDLPGQQRRLPRLTPALRRLRRRTRRCPGYRLASTWATPPPGSEPPTNYERDHGGISLLLEATASWPKVCELLDLLPENQRILRSKCAPCWRSTTVRPGTRSTWRRPVGQSLLRRPAPTPRRGCRPDPRRGCRPWSPSRPVLWTRRPTGFALLRSRFRPDLPPGAGPSRPGGNAW